LASLIKFTLSKILTGSTAWRCEFVAPLYDYSVVSTLAIRIKCTYVRAQPRRVLHWFFHTLGANPAGARRARYTNSVNPMGYNPRWTCLLGHDPNKQPRDPCPLMGQIRAWLPALFQGRSQRSFLPSIRGLLLFVCLALLLACYPHAYTLLVTLRACPCSWWSSLPVHTPLIIYSVNTLRLILANSAITYI
jgi:hypothetical protein